MRHKTQDPQRPDGWPLCPVCGDDEVAILHPSFPELARRYVNECPPMAELKLLPWFCYRCAAEVHNPDEPKT